MGSAKDRFMFAQNIIAKKGGIENIDLAGELAKVQAFININGLQPQDNSMVQPPIDQPIQAGGVAGQPQILMPEQPPSGVPQTQPPNPLI